MRSVLIIFALAILFWVGSGLQAATSVPERSLERKIDSLFSGVIQPDAPGFAVLVKQNGKILYEKGYGVRELRTCARIDAETNFRLASVTKQFTAMAIMLLVHDGRLHYDDRLTDIFLDFPVYGKAITIRHLLTHTSGLSDYEELMDKEEKASGPIWTVDHQIQDDEVFSLLEKQSVGKFAPGTSWAYSNSGYVVLGLIVAKASGMPYRDFLRKRIFAPAGMKHTIVYQKGINAAPNRAFGHSKEKEQFVETDRSATSATLGDGGVYSNLKDLAKWDEALHKHTLLSEKEMASALMPAKLADGSETHWPKESDGDNLAPGKRVSYGFGWFLDPYKDHARMWHSGSTMGFRTVIERFPQDGLTVVILCNRIDLDPGALAEKIVDLLLFGKPRSVVLINLLLPAAVSADNARHESGHLPGVLSQSLRERSLRAQRKDLLWGVRAGGGAARQR